jgi:hypothetical protein
MQTGSSTGLVFASTEQSGRASERSTTTAGKIDFEHLSMSAVKIERIAADLTVIPSGSPASSTYRKRCRLACWVNYSGRGSQFVEWLVEMRMDLAVSP